MRYCFSCRKITSGKARFCNHCGKSYGLAICKRGHGNPRGSLACATCGSKELSSPQRAGAIKRPAVLMLLQVIPFVVLLVATGLYVGAFFKTLLDDPEGLLPLMLLGLVLGLLWRLWIGFCQSLRALLSEDQERQKEP